jgi:hypothetical protein
MRTIPRRALAATLLAAACMDSPNAPNSTLRSPTSTRSAITTTPNDACTVHWASGVAGSWFDASKWSPVGVPTSSSSVCIDAAGTYLVTLDPVTDATPVDVLALTIGGAGATPSLRLSGAATILNVAQGIDIKENGTLDLRNTTGATVTVTRAITNAGTLSITAPCGGCGSGNVINADIVNSGTWSGTGVLSLNKTGGTYENTGAINLTQMNGIVVPAGAGAVTFTQNAGSITPNPSSGTLVLRSGTFRWNGGKVRGRPIDGGRPSVVVDGGTIVIAPTATDSGSIGALANGGAQTTVTGDIPALTALWVAGAANGQAASITFTGNPTNAGQLVVVSILDGAVGGPLTLAGSGRLTNNGTIDQSRNSGSQAFFHYALDVTNNGTWLETTAFGTVLEKAGGTYINGATGTIDMGSQSSVFITSVIVATLTNLGTITGGTLTADANSHVVLAGTQTTDIKSVNGGIIDPGNPLGIASVFLFQPTATGVLRIELGGTTAGSLYDRLDATSFATLGGTLQIVEANGFQSGQCGQVFDVLTHTLASGYGTFANVTGLAPAAGRSLRLLYINATATTKGVVRLVGFDGAQKVCVGPNPVSISEGGAGVQYAIALDHAPTANVVVTATPNAQVTVSPPSLTFTTANWQMPQFFTVTAVDDQAAEGAHTGTITHAVTTTDATYLGFVPAALTANITDNDVNLPPTATNDGATTAEDTPVTVSVLTNDSDPEGQPLTVTAVSAPAHGTAQVTGSGSTVRYAPAANYNGSDSFTYTVSDGVMTSTATVSITVTPVNDLPVANNDQATGRSQTLIAIFVLANDSDPDGGALTVTQVSTPAHGTAAIVSGGQSVTYQSAAGFIGSDQFTYTVTDASGATATATVSVNVLDPTSNSPPVAVVDFLRVTKSSGTIRIDVLDNDYDPDGDRLTIVSATGAASGTVEIKGRSLVYTIVDPHLGHDVIWYTISDGFGGTSSAQATVVWQVPLQVVDLNMDLAILGPGNVYLLNGNYYYGYAVQAQYIADAAIPAGTKIVVTFTIPDGGYSMGQLTASPYPGFIVPHDVDPPVHCLPEMESDVLRRVVCTDDITETVPAGSTIGHNYYLFYSVSGPKHLTVKAEVTSPFNDPRQSNNSATASTKLP